MTREEIINSQEYKANKTALEWWYSLSDEQRKATDIDAEPDIVDAYAEGVIYGRNNPNWISVKDEPYPPKENKWDKESERVLVYGIFDKHPVIALGTYHYNIHDWGVNALMTEITHWMPLPQAPRKEE